MSLTVLRDLRPPEGQRACPFSARNKSGKPRHIQRSTRRRTILARGFGDELLDFLQAGPKLRRWYGEGEELYEEEFLEELEDPGDLPEPAHPSERQTILVTDADSAMGEQLVLQLILARVQVKALVRNAQATKNAFGAYVDALEVRADDAVELQRHLADVQAVICIGRLGAIVPAAKAQKVPHLVLLASAGAASQGLLGSMFMGQEERVLSDQQRQQLVLASSVPSTIVRVGALTSMPGRQSQLSFSQEPAKAERLSIAREDAATVLAQAALQQPPASALDFAVAAIQYGQPPDDWKRVFQDLQAQGKAGRPHPAAQKA